jgi:hypothetical protein
MTHRYKDLFLVVSSVYKFKSAVGTATIEKKLDLDDGIVKLLIFRYSSSQCEQCT